MKIVVIGGSGLIGKKLVKNLRQQGHEVVAASPSSGVDTLTGEGLAEAVAGAQAVVDVANSPSFEDKAAMTFFETSGRNLLAAEAAAGVEHHVALSVVGTERLLTSGYFRAKMAQETLIKAAKIPYTIVRATQFFEFVGSIAQEATHGQDVRLSPALLQPIVSDDVAAALAQVVVGPPSNGTIEVAGPDKIPLDDLVRRFLTARRDTRKVVTDARALYFGIELNDQSLTPGDDPRVGPTHFDDWLRGVGMTQDDRPLGNVATKLLFENDLVRVWEMHLAPGERSDRHRHDLSYLMCVVEGSRIDAEIEGMGHVEIPVQPGSVLFVPPGATETAINASSQPFREILIELKDAGSGSAKLAVANVPSPT